MFFTQSRCHPGHPGALASRCRGDAGRRCVGRPRPGDMRVPWPRAFVSLRLGVELQLLPGAGLL